MSTPTDEQTPHFIHINPEHVPLVQRADHLLSFLRSEAARLEAQLHYVRDAAARSEQEMADLARSAYGVALDRESWIMDAAAGVLRRVVHPVPAPVVPSPIVPAPVPEPVATEADRAGSQ